ncbi:MAG: CBS domain-containing protein [Gammaproteobacteria bacterium]
MSVGQYCNRDVVIVTEDTSIREAADLMRTHSVGTLVVVKEENRGRVPVGLLTDRDIVVELLAEGVDLESVCVGDVMSYELLAVPEQADLLETVKQMRSKGVRRVPVVDQDGTLTGILALDDLIEVLSEVLVDVSRLIAREQHREREKVR